MSLMTRLKIVVLGLLATFSAALLLLDSGPALAFDPPPCISCTCKFVKGYFTLPNQGNTYATWFYKLDGDGGYSSTTSALTGILTDSGCDTNTYRISSGDYVYTKEVSGLAEVTCGPLPAAGGGQDIYAELAGTPPAYDPKMPKSSRYVCTKAP
jgi:hypothetical protein